MKKRKGKKFLFGNHRMESLLAAVIAIPFAVLIYVLLPLHNQKYKLELQNTNYPNWLNCILYSDLDSDGNSEMIRLKSDSGIPAIAITKHETGVNHQINLKGEWVEIFQPVVMDYNSDGYKELVVFLFEGDSLLLGLIKAFPLSEQEVLYVNLDRVRLFQGKQDWIVNTAVSDLTGDGYDDLVVSLIAGFTLHPRKLYRYDVRNHSIKRQKEIFLSNIYNPLVVDLNGDGIKEITGYSYAPNNNPDSTGLYSDSNSHLFLFNPDLELIFPARELGGISSRFHPFILREHNKTYLAGMVTATGESVKNFLHLWEWDKDSLRHLRSKEIGNSRDVRYMLTDEEKEGSFYVNRHGVVSMYNLNFEEESKIKTGILDASPNWQSLDLSGDGKNEVVSLTGSGQVIVYSPGFKHQAMVNFGPFYKNPVLSAFQQEGKHYLHIFSQSRSGLFLYSFNSFYSFRWLFLVSITALFFLLFLTLFRFQRKRLELRQQTRSRLLKFQLANVQQQLEPHFLFNAINNIAHFYQEDRKEEAFSYVSKISRLMLSAMENSEKVSITLEEELFFVHNYLSLEQLRKENFDFRIEVKEKPLLKKYIPKMLIQNFVENSLKHGIFHLSERRGFISISGRECESHYEMNIEDNGIGRKRAAELNTFGTKRGLRNLEKVLDLHKELNHQTISFTILDLYNDFDEAMGTKVIIRFVK